MEICNFNGSLLYNNGPLMKIKEKMHQKVAVLTIKGKLMGPPATIKLVEDVEELIQDGVKRVVLDLKHVNWINSMGVGSILKALSRLNKAGGVLHLVGLTEKVRSVFMMSQLTKIIPINETVNEAIEELNKN